MNKRPMGAQESACPYNVILLDIACIYPKCSEISNTSGSFLVLFSNKMFIKAGIHKVLVSIANKGGPDQTASSEAV